MGHATRCVPVISHLLSENHRVILAGDGSALEFLKSYFPDMECHRFPGIRIRYPSGSNMTMNLVLQLPGIVSGIIREHRYLTRLAQDYRADVVISDNRFGLWSREVYSVYITHQVMIKAPKKLKWAERLFYRLHMWVIRHYDECWIPDLPGKTNLSGDLSHLYPVPGNGSFIGILSRFGKPSAGMAFSELTPGPDLLVLISGPEPQRTIFENLIKNDPEIVHAGQVVMLRGLPGNAEQEITSDGFIIFNHLPDNELRQLILTSKMIICRPGYSTLMDLAELGRTAVLVPTPGQTEQEYLAWHLSEKGAFSCIDQDGFTLKKAIETGRNLTGLFSFRNDDSLLADRIARIGQRLRQHDG